MSFFKREEKADGRGANRAEKEEDAAEAGSQGREGAA